MATLRERLEAANVRNTPAFTFKGTKYLAKVVRVSDGDTVTVAFEPFSDGKMWTHVVRLARCDAAELKSKEPTEYKCARGAKQFLAWLVHGKIVRLECTGIDKFRRILGELYIEEPFELQTNVVDILLDKKMVHRYDGGAKQVGGWDATAIAEGCQQVGAPELPVAAPKRQRKKKAPPPAAPTAP
jgi:endonuclease YncB( thermonuclease family)